MVSSNSDAGQGLAKNAVPPAALARARCDWVEFAETKTMGVSWSDGIFRMLSHTSKPSMSGKRMSRTMALGRICSAQRMPARPHAACAALYPAARRRITSAVANLVSSSTTRIESRTADLLPSGRCRERLQLLGGDLTEWPDADNVDVEGWLAHHEVLFFL